MKHTTCLLILALAVLTAMGQKTRKADSTAVAQTLKTLAGIAKDVDFGDPKTQEIGLFYKAAPYVIYRGKDDKRKWKSFCNYQLEEDKKGVDDVCERINQTINQSGYTILRYFTEKESEGVWHGLEVEYTRKGKQRKAIFAFLKVGKRFGLGDIDG